MGRSATGLPPHAHFVHGAAYRRALEAVLFCSVLSRLAGDDPLL